MNVEQDPRQLTDEKDEDKTHEDGCKIVFKAATALVDRLEEKNDEAVLRELSFNYPLLYWQDVWDIN